MFLGERERRRGSSVPATRTAGEIERFDRAGIPPDAVPRCTERARAGPVQEIRTEATPVAMQDGPRDADRGGDEKDVENDVEHAHASCRNSAAVPAAETFRLSAGLYLQ